MRIALASLLFAGLLAGCADTDPAGQAAPSPEPEVDEDSADLTQGKASASSTYFLVRRDMRKCASPMCGGYFVRRVNRATTTCPVGGSAAECYVAELTFDKTGLDADEIDELQSQMAQGRALVRATLGKKKMPKDYFGTFHVSEGWLAQGPAEATGTFYRVNLNGVRCITSPCPTFDEAKLNSSITGSLAGLDLASSGAPQAALDAAQELLPAGVMVAGSHTKVTGPGGSMNALTASQFYTRMVHVEKACDPDATAIERWSAGVDAETVVVQVASEKEGTSYVDPEGRKVRWVARVSEDKASVSYTVGINDLWAERFTVDRATCAVTVTAEH